MDTHHCPSHPDTIGMINRETAERKEEDGKLWEVVEKIRDRLPNWALSLISVLTFIMGILVAYAFKKPA